MTERTQQARKIIPQSFPADSVFITPRTTAAAVTHHISSQRLNCLDRIADSPAAASSSGVLNCALSGRRGRNTEPAPVGSANRFTAPYSTTRKRGFKIRLPSTAQFLNDPGPKVLGIVFQMDLSLPARQIAGKRQPLAVEA